ncbi:hypothetical protein CLCR_02596 [Cladophialophora carrionii]|uniref:Uncharacterized protein n=1 Tax=Cladophialophora carrionii TaxID=86049 RepID=A0A1C1CF90_9EURO|nr:hypothetical protein CLCR_02596 [Cladophialophora carrionii]
MVNMRCLLCFWIREPSATRCHQSTASARSSSPVPRRNRVSDRNRNRRIPSIPHAAHPLPKVSDKDAVPDPRQSTVSRPEESLSTPSLPLTDPSLQSRPSPESPDAFADQIVKLVWELQRKVIRYVAGLGLQSNEGSLTRSQIYARVLALAESATRDPEECESILADRARVVLTQDTNRDTDKEVARTLQESIKPMSPSSRASTGLVEICILGPELGSTGKETGRNYAFVPADRTLPKHGKRIEFPAMIRDGSRLLEEVEVEFDDHAHAR